MFNDRSWTSYTSRDSGLPDDIVPAIAIDKNNMKWFGTLSGLASFDGENWQVWNTQNSPLPDNQINDIDIDDDGLMWIATASGAAVFDGVDRWVVFTSKNSPLPQGNIYKVRSDKRGNHWFGNDARGLAKLSGFRMPEKAVAQNNNSRGSQSGASQPTDDTPAGPGEENVRINPHLEDGYVTISIGSPSATVTFVNKEGKTVKTIPTYKNGQKINIRNMQKGMYTVIVKTVRGERKIKFNLK